MDIFGRKRIKHLEGVIDAIEKRVRAAELRQSDLYGCLSDRDATIIALETRIESAEKTATISSIELDAREMIGKIQPQTAEDGMLNYKGMIREAWDLARVWDSERKRGA